MGNLTISKLMYRKVIKHKILLNIILAYSKNKGITSWTIRISQRAVFCILFAQIFHLDEIDKKFEWNRYIYNSVNISNISIFVLERVTKTIKI